MRPFVSWIVSITVREYRNWGLWGMLDHTLLLVYDTTKTHSIVELGLMFVILAEHSLFPSFLEESYVSYLWCTRVWNALGNEAHNLICLQHVPDYIPNLPGRNFPIFFCMLLLHAAFSRPPTTLGILLTRRRNICVQWRILWKCSSQAISDSMVYYFQDVILS